MKTNIRTIVHNTCLITTCIVILLSLGEPSQAFTTMITAPYFFLKILGLSFAIALLSHVLVTWKLMNLLPPLLQDALHLIFIFMLVLLCGSSWHWFSITHVDTWIGLFIEVVIIYCFVRYFSYKKDQKEAAEVNEQLKKFKHKSFL